MDLKLFSQIKKNSDSQRDHRHNEAGGHYYMGIHCLAIAKKKRFRDKPLLKKACSYLMDAIRYNRSHPQPYIAVAYIWLLYGEKDKALPYLTKALQLDPNQEDANMLIAYIQQPQAESQQRVKFPVIEKTEDAEEEFSIISFDTLNESPATHTPEIQRSLRRELPSLERRPLPQRLGTQPLAPQRPGTQPLKPQRSTGPLPNLDKLFKKF